MTVLELIEKLKTMPPDAPVVLNMDLNERANGQEASTAEIVDGSYWMGGDTKRVPFEYLNQGDLGGYYPSTKIVSVQSGRIIRYDSDNIP